jgi:hypothetical protein
MKVSEIYASTFLNADALISGDLQVQIDDVAREQINNRNPLVVTFRNDTRKLVLNATVANQIAKAHGDEMESWSGKWITLFRDENVQFEGRPQPGIRVRPTVPTGSGNGLVRRQEEPPPDEYVPF